MLLQRLGESTYADALAIHHRLIREALAHHSGEEIDTQGDAFFAVFGSPRDGVKAVIEIQTALAHQAWPGGDQLRVRMGMHSGEAFDRGAVGLVGYDVHRAARVAGVAHGGQVLLSAASAELVRDALPDGVALLDLGEHRLKDLGRPERIYQLRADGLRTDFAPLKSLDNPALPNNLPAQLTSFIGRERELDEVRALVEVNRLVTLTGAGGSGKTRLALHVAAELLDGSGEGVWLVELASIGDDDAVATSIIEALGIVIRPDRSVVDSLTDSLASQSTLIVLDNCEHVIGGCAKVAEAILRRCPRAYLLATSREPLGIGGEVVYRVPSLSVTAEGDAEDDDVATGSDAVALFVDRARAQGAVIELDEDQVALIARICRRLDGMPLAIELAASRLRALSLSTLDDRLDQRFRLLTGGSRNALARQQTLLATVEWSYSMLNDPERDLLRRLAVCVDGFDLDAAEAVCGREDIDVFEIADVLTSLVDKSLVVAEPLGAGIRYRLLETIRQFGLDRLVESGERQVAAARRAHALHFLALLEANTDKLFGREQVTWYPRLDADRANVRQALEFLASDPDRASGTSGVLRVGAAIRMYWIARLRADEVADLLVPALERPESHADPVLRGRALVTAALVIRSRNLALALSMSEEATSIAESSGDEILAVDAGMALSTLYYFSDRIDEAYAIGVATLERARRLGDDHRLELALAILALSSDRLHPEDTVQLLSEALVCNERTGARFQAGVQHNNAGVYELRQGNLAAAEAHLDQAASAYRSIALDDAIVVLNLGWVWREQGRLTEAADRFAASLRKARRSGDQVDVAYAVLGLACSAADGGAWQRSAILQGFADATIDAVGEVWQHPEGEYRRRSRERASVELGDAAFAQAYDEGRSLDVRSAVDLALDRA